MTRDELFSKYENLMYKAIHYASRNFPNVLEFDELIGVAYEGLVQAENLYDKDNDASFWTYAFIVMRDYCRKAIMEELRVWAPRSKNCESTTPYGKVVSYDEIEERYEDDAISDVEVSPLYKAGAYTETDPTDYIHFNRCVNEYVDGLDTSMEAEIFTQHFLEGKEYEEIAETLHISRRKINNIIEKCNLRKDAF